MQDIFEAAFQHQDIIDDINEADMYNVPPMVYMENEDDVEEENISELD